MVNIFFPSGAQAKAEQATKASKAASVAVAARPYLLPYALRLLRIHITCT